ncbi:hypothetical protein SGRIM128S_08483 [Streptomyces griseomycini]
MAHNIPSWLLASGLVALGMDWKQAVFTIALANVIVLAPMLLTGHAGPEYGVPFPVLARASFGLRGANLPAMRSPEPWSGVWLFPMRDLTPAVRRLVILRMLRAPGAKGLCTIALRRSAGVLR